jgi:hypothetical protein
MSDVRVISTSDATHATGRYFSAELECGAHAALVVVAPSYIAVVVRNASNAAHRGMGKEFPTLDAALAYYKTAAIGAMLRTAVKLSESTGLHAGDSFTCGYCTQRVAQLEGEGLTTSDAQGCADAEHRQAAGVAS